MTRSNKYLDVNVAHLNAREREDARERELAKPHEFGFWFYVDFEEYDVDLTKDFPNLLAIIKIARDLDCRWINFDTDADVLEGVPTFDED